MRVLVLGHGAREHALTARFVSERSAAEVICAPGNPGIAGVARTVPADLRKTGELLAIARRERADLTVVGPELPLSLGVVDQFTDAGLRIFGPTASAARLESSKAFAKEFMARHDVPTARFLVFDREDLALDGVKSGQLGWPVVLKADGLAAGKGVVIAEDRREAEGAVVAAMSGGRFGSAGTRLVVEECLTGPEVSFFVVSDGRRVLPIGTAQDHKRIFDDDRGPNTGGMGAFAPSPLLTPSLHDEILRDIVDPVIAGMANEDCPFRGFLYVGLMLTPSGPKVIEFNVRLGDPEAQVILPLIADPLLPVLYDAAAGDLGRHSCRVSPDKCVGVVIASRGYPDSSESGQQILGTSAAEAVSGVVVYHAGTAERDGQVVTAGGRVLTVVGRASTYEEATLRAYAGVYCVSFEGMQYRRDIGRKAVQSEPVTAA
jgi:phosphoribosylamine--glycine ligase